MTSFDYKKVETALCRKGFTVEKNRTHKIFQYYDQLGRPTRVRTLTSHNNQEVGDSLIGMMSKQLHINRKQLIDLVNCPLGQSEYEEILIEKGIIIYED